MSGLQGKLDRLSQLGFYTTFVPKFGEGSFFRNAHKWAIEEIFNAPIRVGRMTSRHTFGILVRGIEPSLLLTILLLVVIVPVTVAYTLIVAIIQQCILIVATLALLMIGRIRYERRPKAG